MLTLRHALVRQHYGRALKIMMKQTEDKATKDLDGRMVEVSESAITAHLYHRFYRAAWNADAVLQ